ncbi:MAG: hypothetical protein PUI46_01990 [Lachnospiraceae bacterium]|nr:hypothetical protein [Lachnospiraceae bacterium]MDY5701362.1 hypothetical protein [Lachnospiraceae bacterium]
MMRQEFMEHLEKLLWDISENERKEALQYYNDYFDDAGAENEEAVLKELGSPVQVARKIKAGFSENTSEYSEQGYEDTRFRDAMEMIVEEEKQNWQKTEEAKEQSVWEKAAAKQPAGKGWKILAIILLCIFVVPVIVPLGLGILATAFAILLSVIAVIFGIGVAGVGILISGLICFGIGIGKMFLIPAVGLALMGTGCLLFSLGLLLTLALSWCGIKFIPWLIRGVVRLIRFPFRKAGVSI